MAPKKAAATAGIHRTRQQPMREDPEEEREQDEEEVDPEGTSFDVVVGSPAS